MESESNIGLPALYALIAALVGGAIWAIIVVTTNYEIGLIAWAIGGMAGYAVSLPAKDSIGRKHQVIAVIASLIGIILGKYFYFSYLFNDGMAGMFDLYTMEIFTQVFIDLFGGMDIIFVLLAVMTAWQIPGNFAKTVNQLPIEEEEKLNSVNE